MDSALISRSILILMLFFWSSRQNLSYSKCRVKIDDADINYVTEGDSLTLTCHCNCKDRKLNWLAPGGRIVIPGKGVVHLTETIEYHTGSVIGKLTIFNVSSIDTGMYICKSEEISYSLQVTVINIISWSSIPSPGHSNLTCELTGFGNNRPQIRTYWLLPNGLFLNATILSEFQFGHINEISWLTLNDQKSPGRYFCFFELPTPKGSYVANKSLAIAQREKMADDVPGSATRVLPFLVFGWVGVVMVSCCIAAPFRRGTPDERID